MRTFTRAVALAFTGALTASLTVPFAAAAPMYAAEAQTASRALSASSMIWEFEGLPPSVLAEPTLVWEFEGVAEHMAMQTAAFDHGDMSNTYVSPTTESYAIAERAVRGAQQVAGLDDGDMSNTYVSPNTVLAFLRPVEGSDFAAIYSIEPFAWNDNPVWDPNAAIGDVPTPKRDWDALAEDPAGMLGRADVWNPDGATGDIPAIAKPLGTLNAAERRAFLESDL